MTVVFRYVQVHINDEVFLVQLVTFPEKFYLLYSLVYYLDVYHSGLHQDMCYSKVRVFENVCYIYLLGEVFPLDFLSF